MAVTVFITNKRARPIKYAMKSRSSHRSIISGIMPYTGFFILVFVTLHLLNFNLASSKNLSTFNILENIFSNYLYVCFYTISIFSVFLHITHGFWSAFQTIGFNHKKYNKLIEFGTYSIAVIILVGFGFIPVYVMFNTF